MAKVISILSAGHSGSTFYVIYCLAHYLVFFQQENVFISPGSFIATETSVHWGRTCVVVVSDSVTVRCGKRWLQSSVKKQDLISWQTPSALKWLCTKIKYMVPPPRSLKKYSERFLSGFYNIILLGCLPRYLNTMYKDRYAITGCFLILLARLRERNMLLIPQRILCGWHSFDKNVRQIFAQFC